MNNCLQIYKNDSNKESKLVRIFKQKNNFTYIKFKFLSVDNNLKVLKIHISLILNIYFSKIEKITEIRIQYKDGGYEYINGIEYIIIFKKKIAEDKNKKNKRFENQSFKKLIIGNFIKIINIFFYFCNSIV